MEIVAAGLDLYLSACASIAYSEMGWAAEKGGVVEAIWGVRRVSAEQGSPWLLATDEIERHPVMFYRESRGFIKEMIGRFKRLENFVHKDNELSIRWLTWCGFQVEREEDMGFRRFYMDIRGD